MRKYQHWVEEKNNPTHQEKKSELRGPFRRFCRLHIPLAQVIRQRNIKELAFNDGLGFKSRCRTLDKCNHFEDDMVRWTDAALRRNHTILHVIDIYFESASFAYVCWQCLQVDRLLVHDVHRSSRLKLVKPEALESTVI